VLPEVKQASMAVARAERRAQRRPGDADAQAEVVRLRQEFTEQKIVDYVERTVASGPPLRPEQRARIAVVLLGGS
jgi:hypothetical protein